MARKAFGTSLKIGTGPGTVLVSVTSVNGPKVKVDTVDTTTHDSATNDRTFISTLRDNGDVDVEAIFKSLTDIQVATTKIGVDDTDFVITWPFGTPVTCTFKGIITDFEFTGGDVDGMLKYSFKIKISGAITLA